MACSTLRRTVFPDFTQEIWGPGLFYPFLSKLLWKSFFPLPSDTAPSQGLQKRPPSLLPQTSQSVGKRRHFSPTHHIFFQIHCVCLEFLPIYLKFAPTPFASQSNMMGQVVNEGIFSDSQLLFLVLLCSGPTWEGLRLKWKDRRGCLLTQETVSWGAASSCAGSRESAEGQSLGGALGCSA